VNSAGQLVKPGIDILDGYRYASRLETLKFSKLKLSHGLNPDTLYSSVQNHYII
jgi:hypothetical protein